jgi:hypothetical protein
MTTTRKLLVSFDPKKPEGRSSDFLVVVVNGGEAKLIGLKSKRRIQSGVMIYLGKDITANDLFGKLVDTGQGFEDAEQTLQILENYIHKLQPFRIGSIIGVEADTAVGFNLVKLADAPPRSNASTLP